jgi:hypothetical protein
MQLRSLRGSEVERRFGTIILVSLRQREMTWIKRSERPTGHRAGIALGIARDDAAGAVEN